MFFENTGSSVRQLLQARIAHVLFPRSMAALATNAMPASRRRLIAVYVFPSGNRAIGVAKHAFRCHWTPGEFAKARGNVPKLLFLPELLFLLEPANRSLEKVTFALNANKRMS